MYETIFEHLGRDGGLSKITFEFDQRVKVVADYEEQEIRQLHGDIEVKSFCMEGVTPSWFMGYLTGIESEIANREPKKLSAINGIPKQYGWPPTSPQI